MIGLKQLQLGPMANFVYLIGDPATKECAVVDPAWDPEAILRAAEEAGWTIRHLLATHNHPDHVNAVEPLLKRLDVPVWIHQEDAYALAPLGAAVKQVRGGDTLKLGTLDLKFLHTPGHTAGSQCFQITDSLLTGDTLFIKGCGRVDLPTSDPEQMYRSLRRIAELPDATILLPGHDYGDKPCAPLSEEKAANPYLKASATRPLEDFLKFVGF